MTKKDYELAAKQISDGHFGDGNLTDHDRHVVAYFCCKLFKADNESFNKDLFLSAANIDPDAINWHLGIVMDEVDAVVIMEG